MTRSKISLHHVAMATAAILALGLFAAPAQAGNIAFTFSFGVPSVHGSGGNGSSGNGFFQPAPTPQVAHCMTNRQIINSMNDHGYRNVQFKHEREHGKPMFSYWSRGWTYKAKVDRCSGHLVPVTSAPVHLQPQTSTRINASNGAVIYQIN